MSRRNEVKRDWPGHFLIGVFMIVIGSLFLLDNLNILETRRFFHFWPTLLIAWGVFRLATAVDAQSRIGGVFFIGLGGLFLATQLGYVRANPWQLIWPALIIWWGVISVMGFDGVHGFHRFGQTSKGGREDSGTDSVGTVNMAAIVGKAARRVNSKDFRAARISTFIGGAELDLRDAGMVGNEATIDINTMIGGLEIRVPSEWSVVNQVTPLIGGVDDKTESPKEETKRLIIRGSVFLGGLEIRN